MADPTIRPMTSADVRPAAELLERGDWGPSAARLAFFDFDVTPVVPVEEAVPLFMKTNAWRQSVS